MFLGGQEPWDCRGPWGESAGEGNRPGLSAPLGSRPVKGSEEESGEGRRQSRRKGFKEEMVTDYQRCGEPEEDEDRKVSTGPSDVGTTGGMGWRSAPSGSGWWGAHKCRDSTSFLPSTRYNLIMTFQNHRLIMCFPFIKSSVASLCPQHKDRGLGSPLPSPASGRLSQHPFLTTLGRGAHSCRRQPSPPWAAWLVSPGWAGAGGVYCWASYLQRLP